MSLRHISVLQLLYDDSINSVTCMEPMKQYTVHVASRGALCQFLPHFDLFVSLATISK